MFTPARWTRGAEDDELVPRRGGNLATSSASVRWPREGIARRDVDLPGAEILRVVLDDVGDGGRQEVEGGRRRAELLEQRLARVPSEANRRFANRLRCTFLTELLSLEVAVERVEEEAVVWNGEPVEDLLLLLCTDAVVLEEEF